VTQDVESAQRDRPAIEVMLAMIEAGAAVIEEFYDEDVGAVWLAEEAYRATAEAVESPSSHETSRSERR
jgi:hypothetical protein